MAMLGGPGGDETEGVMGKLDQLKVGARIPPVRHMFDVHLTARTLCQAGIPDVPL